MDLLSLQTKWKIKLEIFKLTFHILRLNGILNCDLIKTTDTVLHFGKTRRAVT